MCCGAETSLREGERAVGEENTTHDRGPWTGWLCCYATVPPLSEGLQFGPPFPLESVSRSDSSWSQQQQEPFFFFFYLCVIFMPCILPLVSSISQQRVSSVLWCFVSRRVCSTTVGCRCQPRGPIDDDWSLIATLSVCSFLVLLVFFFRLCCVCVRVCVRCSSVRRVSAGTD